MQSSLDLELFIDKVAVRACTAFSFIFGI
jgi:hypothetical protein